MAFYVDDGVVFREEKKCQIDWNLVKIAIYGETNMKPFF